MSYTSPQIIAPPPGPQAQSWIHRDDRYISPSYTRPYPCVVERGEGVWVWDVDGNRYLDCSAGLAVCSTGHCHPEVVQAIRDQAEKLIHMSGTDFYYPAQIELAETLARLAPGGGPRRVFFSNSGAEAIECAFKLARYATGRQKIIAFYGGFHGRTLGALSLTASKPIHRKGFAPLVPGVLHIPYANCYHCAYNLVYPSCKYACVSFIEDTLFRYETSPEEVAAILVEPIQGEGGYVVPPPEYHQALKEVADRHGILLIADEVQCGIGRTGTMFAIEHWGVSPDIVAVAKGIASGMPLGVTLARQDLMTWPPGAHASTFGGNPVSCAAALATIRLVQNRYMDNAKQMGERLMAGLKTLMSRHACIGDVRGKGLMVGVELVRDERRPDPDLTQRVIERCFQKGMLILTCGKSTIRFMPPLIIEPAEIDLAIHIFEAALSECKS
ncbi:MAG: acetyl ornithine aminotransferase family protein [candidate division Zixibacteria bacterium]|nr:acetyl ornithine aminotransferase family protein [candidate division Zixibacteria bacterium]